MLDKYKMLLFKIINIAILIGSIFLFIWLGLKGILGFFLGVGITTYLIFSKNVFLMGMVRLLNGDLDAGELFRK